MQAGQFNTASDFDRRDSKSWAAASFTVSLSSVLCSDPTCSPVFAGFDQARLLFFCFSSEWDTLTEVKY